MTKTAKDYMQPVVVIQVDTSNSDTIAKMLETSTRFVVCVGANNNIKGIITATNFVREIAFDVKSRRILEGTVEALMTDDIHYVTEDALMVEVARKMDHYHLQSVVVLHGLSPIGVINQLDVLRWWHEEIDLKK